MKLSYLDLLVLTADTPEVDCAPFGDTTEKTLEGGFGWSFRWNLKLLLTLLNRKKWEA